MLADAGCDLMFMPEVGEIYPNGADQATRVEVPGISNILCGEFRPGHFEGVATVVAKLFNIVDADVAIFGEKDFQQLTVIRRMAADLCLRVEIVGAPTVREPDGLAMSSRNQYLDEAQRKLAPTIYRQLQQAVAALQSGVREYAKIEAAGRAALDGAGFRTDYFSVRDAKTLAPAKPDTKHFVVLDGVAPRQGAAHRQRPVHGRLTYGRFVAPKLSPVRSRFGAAVAVQRAPPASGHVPFLRHEAGDRRSYRDLQPRDPVGRHSRLDAGASPPHVDIREEVGRDRAGDCVAVRAHLRIQRVAQPARHRAACDARITTP